MDEEELINLRQRIRHSAAHVMADVVTSLYPEVKLAIGPPTDDGFYYDFLTDEPFTDEDLSKIEQGMDRVIGLNLPFEYTEYSREEIVALK